MHAMSRQLFISIMENPQWLNPDGEYGFKIWDVQDKLYSAIEITKLVS